MLAGGGLQEVKGRAEELKRSLDDVILTLQAGGTALAWEHVLSRFNMVNIQYGNMIEQVKELLKQFVVYPKLVDNQQLADILPIMLSSKLLPEMEEADAAILSESGNPALDGPLDHVFGYLNEQVDQYNGVIDYLVHGTASAGPLHAHAPPGISVSQGILDPKEPNIKSVHANSAAIKTTIDAAKAAYAQYTDAMTQGPAVGSAAAIAAAKRKRKAPPIDPLVHMMLTGQGLRAEDVASLSKSMRMG